MELDAKGYCDHAPPNSRLSVRLAQALPRKLGDIRNLEQIQEIYSVYLQMKDKSEVHHVNRHIGIQGNELADRMSLLAADELEVGWRRHPEQIIIDDVLGFSGRYS